MKMQNTAMKSSCFVFELVYSRIFECQTPLHGHRLRTPPTDELTTILQLVVQEA